jgi:hypothetical protein
MRDISETGVLLVDKASSAPVGLIKFDSSGVVVYQNIKRGLHVFAFQPIHKLLSEQWMKEPLYKKHASLLDDNQMLPEEVLEQEADSCAEFLNTLESPLTLGGAAVEAQVLHVSSGSE